MPRRKFDLADTPIRANLERLDHLCQSPPCEDAEHLDSWLCSVIQSVRQLPAAVAKHFDLGRYCIGDTHFRMNPSHLPALWETLNQGLAAELDRVRADEALKPENAPDFGDRRPTRGERIEALCEKLFRCLRDGGPIEQFAAQLEYEGAGTEVQYDATRLRKLLRKRRMTGEDRSAMYARVTHAQIVAGNLHHLA